MSLFFNNRILREGEGAGAGAGSGAGSGAGDGKGAGTGDLKVGADGKAIITETPPVPFFKGLYGDDGKIDKTAWDRLPDRLKPYKDQFSKYDTVEAVLDGFGNAHSMAVKKALAPLTGTEPPEIVQERNQLLDTIQGVPKDIKGYGFTRENIAKDLPEQFWDQTLADEFAALCQRSHMSPADAKAALLLQVKATKAQLAAAQTAETEYYQGQDLAFEKAMKTAGIDMDKAIDLSVRGAATLGIDPKSPIFKNAAVRAAMVRFANLVAEDKIVRPGDPEAGTGDELAEARDIASNPQNPLYKAYNDPLDPRHEMAKARRNELYRIDGEKKLRRGAQA